MLILMHQREEKRKVGTRLNKFGALNRFARDFRNYNKVLIMFHNIKGPPSNTQAEKVNIFNYYWPQSSSPPLSSFSLSRG